MVAIADGPLLVFGPLSPTYDFGPSHPLTPRRFGPGIELLRAVGAEPGLAPQPASDEDLRIVHTARYIEAVKRLSVDPSGPGEAGIGVGGDNPSFPGMHEAGAMVAGGSLRAVEAILRGEVEHAFHPGGGLHHAMRQHASGFCIYDDPALAIARARGAGLRVLYVDFDVHHGDGVELIHEDDPGVMTVSFHESGRYLFPGTGRESDLGEGVAAGTLVNVSFEPYAGEDAWLPAVTALVPALAAAFGPDLIVSQHGADSHALDPLAHLRLTTTAMGEAARLVDRVAHRWAAGRWLATGGGGYDAYRVVPRAWALTWLAGAHRDVPPKTPTEWREKWAAEASRYGQAPLPSTFTDPPNAGIERDRQQDLAERESSTRAADIAAVVLPAFLRAAAARGWWSALQAAATSEAGAGPGAVGEAAIVDVTADVLDRVALAARVIPPADPVVTLDVLRRALVDPDALRRPVAVAAIAGSVVVGLAIAAPSLDGDSHELLALGVAPEYRRRHLATALAQRVVARIGGRCRATITVAERDVVEPLDIAVRRSVAQSVLRSAGFREVDPRASVARIDRQAVAGDRP